MKNLKLNYMMKIPIFKLKFDFFYKIKFMLKSFQILTANRPIGESKFVKIFEDKFKNLVNSKYTISCSNGTTAIDLALRAINVKNKKVLIPSNTFFATSVAVNNAGGEIELLDIELDSLSICPKDLESKISDKIGAVIIVHIGGIISKHIFNIVNICKKYNVPIIEDAAHAHCSNFKGTFAGSFGHIGCFSFFPTKVMTTGEGGMITTNNEDYFLKMKSLKNFGRDLNDSGICVNKFGNNYKIHEFTGLLGSLECDRVLSRIQKRNLLVQRYLKNLEGSSYTPVIQSDGLCSYYKMILKIKIDREWLRKFCSKNGITLTGEVYKIPVHQQPLYSNLKNNDLPNTNDFCANHICPPLYPELNFSEIDYICKILIKAENKYEK